MYTNVKKIISNLTCLFWVKIKEIQIFTFFELNHGCTNLPNSNLLRILKKKILYLYFHFKSECVSIYTHFFLTFQMMYSYFGGTHYTSTSLKVYGVLLEVLYCTVVSL